MYKHKYAIEIFYSEEDEEYIAIVPELPGCSAFGETEEEALKEVKIAMDLWLETARREKRKIPEPHGKEFLNLLYSASRTLESHEMSTQPFQELYYEI